MKKRFRMLALVLSACMMLNLAPMTALAAESTPQSEIVLSGSSADADDTDASEETTGAEEAVTPQPEETTPSTEEVVEAGSDETENDSEVEPQSESEETTDDLESVEEEEEQELLEATSTVFTVDGQGTLVKFSSKELSGDIDIAKMLPEGAVVKIIPADIFKGNTGITSVVIPSTVQEFKTGAFDGCENLTTVKFENDTVSATEFPEAMFRGCTKLAYSAKATNFKIPAGVQKIGQYCFQGCTSIGGVDFSKATSLTEVGDSAFIYCSALNTLKNFDKTAVTKIDSNAFANTAVNQTIAVPTTLVSISSNAFANCSKLYSIDLSSLDGASLTIGKGAFSNSGLKSISLPDTYHTLTEGVFLNCTNMTTVTIGSSKADTGVTTIATGAFEGCTGLTEVILNESVTEVANNAFKSCNKVVTIKSLQGKSLTYGNSMKLSNNSFPINKGMTIYGYDGNIQDWQGKHISEEVKFSSLYTGLAFDINEQKDGNSVTVAGAKSVVTLGDKVNVTPKAAKNYTLISMTHGTKNAYVGSAATTDESGASTYSFAVTNSDVDSEGKIPVNVAFANVSQTDTTFTFEIKENDYVTYANTNDAIEINTLGQSVPLSIRAINSNYGSVTSNPWLWSFKSNNTNCVKVDANGKIRAVASTTGTKDGYATVTATLNANKKIVVTAKVYVEAVQKFNSISSVSFEDTNKMTKAVDSQTGLNTIVFSKSWVEAAKHAKKTRDVNVTVEALDTNGLEMDTAFTWKSANTAIATVASATTESTSNTIKVCGVGETIITATSKEKSATTKETASIQFIVRVVDKTPAVSDSTIVINTKSNKGTEFNIVRSYNGAISTDDIEIVQYSNKKWVSMDKFSVSVVSQPVERADGDYDQTLNIGLYTDSKYANKETSVADLYVKCLVDNTDYVYAKLPTVKITAKAPAPKVTIAGKVNTFYKATAETKDDTSVTATVAKVAGYEWDTSKEVSLDCLDTDTGNVFKENFDVEPVKAGDYSKLTIYQKAEELKVYNEKDKKLALTGYLVIPYKNGIEAKVKITIGTQKVAPAYVLSSSTVTTSKFAKAQSFNIQLLDKKTKKVIDLTDKHSFDKYAAGSTPLSITTLTPAVDVETDTITVTTPADGISANSKAIIVLRNTNWNQTLTYPLTIKVATANPKIVLGTSNIQINIASATQNSTTAALKDAYITGLDVHDDRIVSTNKGKAKTEADKVSWEYDNGKLKASVQEDNLPAKGKYTYTVPYTGTYVGGNTYDATVAVTVQILEAVPTVKLNATTFTLNDNLYGVTDGENAAEIAATTYSVLNLPADGAYTVDMTEAELINTTQKKNPVSYGVGGNTAWTSAGSPIAFDLNAGKFSIYLTKKLNGVANTFTISKVKVDGKTIADLKITVKSNLKKPTIKLAPKGTINVLDGSSAITYTLTVANYSGTVDPRKLQLISEYVPDKTNSSAGTWKLIPSEMAGHFVFDAASVNGNKINLIVNDSERADLQGITYKINANYAFGTDADNATYTSEVCTIAPKPTQSMPKLTLSANTMNLYAANPSYGNSITVTSKNTAVSIDDIEWSKNTSKDMQKAFEAPIYDASTGKLTIKIKNAALLKKNTTYTLKYCIKNDNQLTGNNVQGTEFAVKVTVK